MTPRRFLALFLVSLLAVALPAAGPALAAPPEEGAHGGGHESPSVFQGSAELAIWTLVVFLLLLFVLSKFAWKPILEALRRREEHIRAAVEEAKIARAETEKARAEFRAELAKAHEQIPKLMEEARKDAERLAAERKAKADADIQADRQRLRREIEMAKDQALLELRTHTAQLATLISAKALGRTVSEDDHRRLVDEALDELRQRARERAT